MPVGLYSNSVTGLLIDEVFVFMGISLELNELMEQWDEARHFACRPAPEFIHQLAST